MYQWGPSGREVAKKIWDVLVGGYSDTKFEDWEDVFIKGKGRSQVLCPVHFTLEDQFNWIVYHQPKLYFENLSVAILNDMANTLSKETGLNIIWLKIWSDGEIVFRIQNRSFRANGVRDIPPEESGQ